MINYPDLDVPDVGPVLPGEVPHLGHAERHGADAEVELLPVQGGEQVLEVLGIIVKLNKNVTNVKSRINEAKKLFQCFQENSFDLKKYKW